MNTVLDCLGKPCPAPVIELARAIGTCEVGASLVVLADDPAAAYDIPAWCRMRGQEFVGRTEIDGRPAYEVRRLS